MDKNTFNSYGKLTSDNKKVFYLGRLLLECQYYLYIYLRLMARSAIKYASYTSSTLLCALSYYCITSPSSTIIT